MNTIKARKLYHDHANAVGYIEVENAIGDRSIGTCFHIGEGVFVTARHVVEGMRIVEVRVTEPVLINTTEYLPDALPEFIAEAEKTLKDRLGFIPSYKRWLDPLSICEGPFFHSDDTVDVAVFRVKSIHHAAGLAKLGVHWDDWIYRGHWHLSETILLGYPPIPLTSTPHLIAAKAEIHTFVILRGTPHVHFIVSATARGGFSGGPAIHEGGFVLGLVTTSLVRDSLPAELGFQAVLSIEPIRQLLEQRGLMPEVQKRYADTVLHGESALNPTQ